MPHRATLALCAICLLIYGCSTSGPGAHAGQPYIVNSQRTLFYTYGPAQTSGPDFALYHGERLTMLSYQYGYSQITIPETGQTGYVPTEDLAPAPPAPKPTPTPSSPHHHRPYTSSRPPTPEEESQVPLPEFPESKPPPGAPPFRY
jgi:hypothetical protein